MGGWVAFGLVCELGNRCSLENFLCDFIVVLYRL